MIYPLARQDHGIHYILLEPLEPGQASFSFIGNFQGQEVSWDCRLQTLGFHRSTLPSTERQNRTGGFMQIGDASESRCSIHIVLDIATIDTPTVLRSIIMVRNYRRLRPGRQELSASTNVQY